MENHFHPSHLQNLIDIENGLGVYACGGATESVKKDAGRLYDAIQAGDGELANKIGQRYYRELPKGDCTGGPKYIKPGSAAKKAVARAAMLFFSDFKRSAVAAE